jgi:hypothetical protein
MDNRPRLPPGQHAVEHLPVLHVGSVPAFDPETWDLRIEGEVRTPRRFTYQELRAFPSVIAVSDFHCVEGWSRLDCAWQGLRFSDLCDLVSPTARARFVTVGCDGGPSTGSGSPPASQQGPPRAQPRGGYTTSLPLDDLLESDVLQERQVGPVDSLQLRSGDRLLGSPRLQQHGRSVARGTPGLKLAHTQHTLSRPPPSHPASALVE